MPSMIDVSSRAGVAPSTVSLVINGKKNVSPRLRQRVESAIKELGLAGAIGVEHINFHFL